MSKLNDDISFHLNVSGDWVYYSNDSDNGNLYKIRTDGSERTKLNESNSVAINIVDDWIYFVSNDDNCFYRIRADGLGQQLVA